VPKYHHAQADQRKAGEPMVLKHQLYEKNTLVQLSTELVGITQGQFESSWKSPNLSAYKALPQPGLLLFIPYVFIRRLS